MINSQKPDKFSLGSLFGKLSEGNFVIPDFQRDFEWDPWDISDLIKSIFQDYYVGTLLLWKAKKENFQALSCAPIYGFKSETKSPIHIVLDGQQRLTAIYYACFAPDQNFPKRKNRCYFFVKIDQFMSDEYESAFYYEWDTKQIQKLLSEVTEQYEKNIMPLSILGKDMFVLVDWLTGYKNYWQAKHNDALTLDNHGGATTALTNINNSINFTNHVKALLNNYHISYIELDEGLVIEKVCEIFTKINSRGVRLDIFDLINAMLVPKELKLKFMWQDVEERLSFAATPKMNIYVLQVMSILLQAYCSPKYLYFLIPGTEKPSRGQEESVTLIPNKDVFEKYWEIAVDSIEGVLNVLKSPHDYGAIKPDFIPYPTIIPVFSALRYEAQLRSSRGFSDANRKVKKWYWSSIFTNAYSSAAESTSAKDYRDVKAWMDDDSQEPTVIGRFRETLKSLDLRTESRKGSAIYNAIFNLFIINGAKDWSTHETPSYDALDDHHIIPVAWGNKMKTSGLIKDEDIHSILNRSPLTDSTNRHIIGQKLPNEYFPEMFKHYGEAVVRQNLSRHYLSEESINILLRQNFGPSDFVEFLASRQKTILTAIQDLLLNEHVDLDPSLKELDHAIEKIELSLRKLIVDILGEDLQKIPQDIRDKAAERVQRDLRKDASKNPDDYKSTSRYLEYFDLSEYLNTITNKALWPDFQIKIGNKEVFIARFSKLAEIRNMIRHSRSVDEVVKKEGDAAITWFTKLLAAT